MSSVNILDQIGLEAGQLFEIEDTKDKLVIIQIDPECALVQFLKSRRQAEILKSAFFREDSPYHLV